MSEPLPCPFCGGEATTHEISWHAGKFGGHFFKHPYFQIDCSKCRAAKGDYDTEAEAIAAWNTRYLQTVQCIDCTWFENRSESGAYCGYFDRELGDDYDGGCLWGATSGYPLQEKPAWNTRAERTCRMLVDPKTECRICSECKSVMLEGFNYCPNCGARVI